MYEFVLGNILILRTFYFWFCVVKGKFINFCLIHIADDFKLGIITVIAIIVVIVI